MHITSRTVNDFAVLKSALVRNSMTYHFIYWPDRCKLFHKWHALFISFTKKNQKQADDACSMNSPAFYIRQMNSHKLEMQDHQYEASVCLFHWQSLCLATDRWLGRNNSTIIMLFILQHNKNTVNVPGLTDTPQLPASNLHSPTCLHQQFCMYSSQSQTHLHTV